MSLSVMEVKRKSVGRWEQIILEHAPHLKDIITRGKKHGPCPLCGGKDRARCHNDFKTTGGVFCNQCGGGSDGIAVLKWANSWTFLEALKAVGEDTLGIKELPSPERKTKEAVVPVGTPDMVPEMLDWLLNDRNLSELVVSQNHIGYKDGYYTFPYYKSGQLVNIQSRTADKSEFRLVKGCELPLYGYDFIDDSETVWTEGQIDMMSVQTAGFQHVISSPNGAKSYTFFESMSDRLEEVEKFILWMDNDEDGKAHEQEIARRIGYDRCKRVIPVAGCKDANDVLVKHGVEAVQDAILNAVDFPVEGCIQAGDLDLIGHYDYGNYEGISTGFKSMDNFLKFDAGMGELIVVHGIPSSGKSEVVDAMMINTSIGESEWKWAVFSPENYPLEYHAEKLAEKIVKKSFRGNKNRMTADEVIKSQNWMDKNIFFVMPKEEEITIEGTLKVLAELKLRKGIRGAIIDPLNEYGFPAGDGLTETQWITNQLTKIRRFARNHCQTIVLVCHPTKLRKEDSGRYEGGFAPPSAYQIAGSASFRSKADAIFCVHRPKYGQTDENGVVELHIQKVKKKYLGKVGMTQIFYQFYTGTYGSYPDPDYPFNTEGFVS